METHPLITIQPGTHPQVINRIPKIIEGIADGKAIGQIAKELGVERVAIWKNLQRVDFAPLIAMLVTDTVSDIALVEDPYKRGYLRSYFLGKIHSKKVKAEVTTRIHQLTEERQTFRVEFEALSPEDQQTWIRLNEKMGRRLVESEQADP